MDDKHTLFAGRFFLQELISQSNTAEVYRAVDQQTGLTVAIKRLVQTLPHPSLQQQFGQEVRILQQLDHPHIVKLIDAGKTADGQYLVLPYYDGGSLASLLAREGSFSIERVLKIGIALADALRVIHEQHITHGDLKPGNIILSEMGDPILADFGAAHLDQGKRFLPRGTVLGTYEYLSPEACNRDLVDSRTDIWSLGVMLYEMLTGKLPFSHPKVSHLLIAIMMEPPPDIQQLRPDLGDRFADLIYRMLAKDPNQRIPTAELVVAELTAIWQTNGFALESDMGVSSFADMMTWEMVGPQHNLPTNPMLFVGRQRELEEIHRLLLDPGYRLVTIHGSGGIGKTRLAMQVAQHYLEETEEDVFVVDLAAVDSPDLLVTAVAETIHFHFFGRDEPEEQLLNYLQGKRMLLVLDNFEHLITQAGFLSRILLKTFDVQILVTSQERLNVREEWVFPLEGLPVIDPLVTSNEQKPPAVELFIETGRRARRDYAPSEEELNDIREICTLVEGVPLAIELAAGWVNRLTPAAILTRLREGFEFLATDLPHLPARHRSTRSVFEYAWELLNPEEKQTVRRLSVFRGRFSLDASRRITGTSIPTLYKLIDKALLRRSPVSGQFSMQAMVRQFAAQKLSLYETEQIMIRTRHAEYYLRGIYSLRADLKGERQADALQDIEREISNIRVAWQWAALQGDPQLLDLGTDALFSFYQLRGRQREGAQSFAQAVQGLKEKTRAQTGIALCRLLARQGVCNRFIGRLEEARSMLQESLNLARTLGDLREMAFSLYQLGAAMPNEPGIMAYWEESLAVAEALDDQTLIAEVLNWLAFGLFREGRIDEAVETLERSLVVRRALSDHHGLANALTNLGVVQIHLGNYGKAKDLLQEGLLTYQQIGDIHGVAAASNNLSHTALNMEDYKAAQRWGKQALDYFRRVGDKKAEGEALGNLATVALQQEDYELARTLCLQCIELYMGLGLPTSSYYKDLGRVALAQNEWGEAYLVFRKALQEEPSTAVTLDILTGIAAIWMQEGKLTDAVALFTFVQQHPVSEQIVRDRATEKLQLLDSRMPSAEFAAAQSDGKEKSLELWLTYVL
ncbi:MAG: protein kinase [Ardenticatenaceae bacterium]|nr:protein kinase [Ardenticatenaceae bacterium]